MSRKFRPSSPHILSLRSLRSLRFAWPATGCAGQELIPAPRWESFLAWVFTGVDVYLKNEADRGK